MRGGGAVDPVAVRWLVERGVWKPALAHAENMRRVAEFRASMGRLGADPGKGWARDLVAAYRDGQRVPRYSLRLAMAALDMREEPIVERPARPVPRPDIKDRAAGDVEVEVVF